MTVLNGNPAHVHVEVEPKRDPATRRVPGLDTRRKIRCAMSFVITEPVSLMAGANVPAGGPVIAVKVSTMC